MVHNWYGYWPWNILPSNIEFSLINTCFTDRNACVGVSFHGVFRWQSKFVTSVSLRHEWCSIFGCLSLCHVCTANNCNQTNSSYMYVAFSCLKELYFKNNRTFLKSSDWKPKAWHPEHFQSQGICMNFRPLFWNRLILKRPSRHHCHAFRSIAEGFCSRHPFLKMLAEEKMKSEF